MKHLLTLLIVIFMINESYGLSGWLLQSPYPTGNTLSSVDFEDNSTGWAIGWYHTIIKTTNGGTNWAQQTSGTTNYLESVEFTDNSNGWVVGSGGIILRTTNGGTNWTPQTSGTSNHLSSVHFADNSTGWVVGSGGTILKTTTGGILVGIQSISTEIPEQFLLSQNYPNPFNPATTIAFGIPQSGNVTLKIFDMAGREVKTLVNEYRDAGYYVAKFDGSSLASGTYIYRLESGNYVSVKMMVLLK